VQPHAVQPQAVHAHLGQQNQGQQNPGQPGYGPPPGAVPPPDPRLQTRRRSRLIALAVLVVGIVGFLIAAGGVITQVMPRSFSAAQRQQITDWQYLKRWRTLPAGTIFPASVSYTPPNALSDDSSLMLSARRIGIAKQATCTAAADPAAARTLASHGCSAVLRATYVDGTGSYVVTVGAAVMPGATQAAAAAQGINNADGASGLGSTVRTVDFAHTAAAAFTDKRRQLSGAVAAGSYVVLYAVGYADDRPAEPVAANDYTDGEMTSAGTGVAKAVLSVLAAPVPSPRCPGTPGC
jgi:hypothetical protein